MCCPSVPGPAKWPSRAPPENIWLPEAGSSSVMRTSTFLVRFPQQSTRLKISPRRTLTVVLYSMANQGKLKEPVWQPKCALFPSMQPAADFPCPVEICIALRGSSSTTPVNTDTRAKCYRKFFEVILILIGCISASAASVHQQDQHANIVYFGQKHFLQLC